MQRLITAALLSMAFITGCQTAGSQTADSQQTYTPPSEEVRNAEADPQQTVSAGCPQGTSLSGMQGTPAENDAPRAIFRQSSG